MLEVNVSRLRRYRSITSDTDVFRETACPYSEDFIAGLEFSHVPADRFNGSGEIRSRRGIFRLPKSKDKPADTAFQHATVDEPEGNGTNADEDDWFVWAPVPRTRHTYHVVVSIFQPDGNVRLRSFPTPPFKGLGT